MSAMKPRASCNHGPKGMRRKGPILCVEFALFKFPSWQTKSQRRPIFCPPFFLAAAQPLSPSTSTSMSQPKFGFLQIWVCLSVLVDQQHQRTPATSTATSTATTSIADRLPPVMNFGCRSHHFGGTNGFGTTRLLGSAETTHKKTQNGPPNAEHWSKRQIIYMQNGK